jgi:hypothetical protein
MQIAEIDLFECYVFVKYVLLIHYVIIKPRNFGQPIIWNRTGLYQLHYV